ncbi:GNAT family N-acetyltransferase [Sporomusa sp.]|uniref:GNAT family N-acetyltransferase n=1 Tax=Sporomusa sp. TaxID=2078658 RepID=UPI002BF71C8E|nr:GNAT family N-acetyltransferase [Sporomusa sp.]HWR44486.1 GNAT family N-acetyltransferase [Sporomusa sp.]
MVELITTYDNALIERLVQLETEAFGSGGINMWHLVPLIRHGRVYVIRKNESVVGTVQYMLDWDNPRKAYMLGVSVSREHRGLGIGTELLRESFIALTGENVEEVELTVAPGNVAAINVYENKLGFVVTEFRKNEYGEGEDRLAMRMSLTN